MSYGTASFEASTTAYRSCPRLLFKWNLSLCWREKAALPNRVRTTDLLVEFVEAEELLFSSREKGVLRSLSALWTAAYSRLFPFSCVVWLPVIRERPEPSAVGEEI